MKPFLDVLNVLFGINFVYFRLDIFRDFLGEMSH